MARRSILLPALCAVLCLVVVPRAFVPAPARSPAAAAAALALASAPLALGFSGAEGAHAAAAIELPAAAINPVDAVVQAFALTFVSEIGDKTFFIAAILAANGNGDEGASRKVLTFVGAIGALAVMTFLAVAIGQVFHAVPDVFGGIPIDDYASILAFGYFGVKLLLDASSMSDESSLLNEEKEEAEEAVKGVALPSWISGGAANVVLPPLVLQAFVLVFAAEVGDRSFITATALSAQGGPEGGASVFAGAIAAHSIATILAVGLGEVISSYVSEKTITTVGGVLFLLFAATSTSNVLKTLM